MIDIAQWAMILLILYRHAALSDRLDEREAEVKRLRSEVRGCLNLIASFRTLHPTTDIYGGHP